MENKLIQLNRALFTTKAFDSRSLGVLASLVHPCTEAGDLNVEIARGGRVQDRFTVQVVKEGGAPQISIDMAASHKGVAADCDCHKLGADDRLLLVNGALCFFASTGVGGYSVRITKRDEKRTLVLDSAKETPAGDLYTVTLVRPGAYSVKVGEGKAMEVKVRSPKGAKNYDPRQGTLVAVDPGKGFDPKSVEQLSGATLAFQFKSAGSLVATLEKADDSAGDAIIRTPKKPKGK